MPRNLEKEVSSEIVSEKHSSNRIWKNEFASERRNSAAESSLSCEDLVNVMNLRLCLKDAQHWKSPKLSEKQTPEQLISKPVKKLGCTSIKRKMLPNQEKNGKRIQQDRIPKDTRFKPIYKCGQEMLSTVEQVKLADNIDTPSDSRSTESIAVLYDSDNPLNLDVDGLDRAETLRRDEQDKQNRRENIKIKRFFEKRKIKALAEELCKADEHLKRIGISPNFSTNDGSGLKLKDLPEEVRELIRIKEDNFCTEPRVQLGTSKPTTILQRTLDKPRNRSIRQMEMARTLARYQILYERRMEKEAIAKEKKDGKAKYEEENRMKILIESPLKNEFEEMRQRFLEKQETLKTPRIPKKYPQNMHEVKTLKDELRKSRKEIIAKVRIKKEFYENLGKRVFVKGTELADSSSMDSLADVNEEYLDEQNINVEIRDSRGRISELRKTSGVMDGEQQPQQRSEVNKFSLKKLEDLQKIGPEIVAPLRNRSMPKPSLNLESKACGEIYNFGNLTLRSQIERLLCSTSNKPKRIKIVKPKRVKIKKFNLAQYLYGVKKCPKNSLIVSKKRNSISVQQLSSNDRETRKKRRAARQKKRFQRLRYLGIPYEIPNLERKEEKQFFVSESSEWVPSDKEVSNYELSPNASIRNLGRSGYSSIDLWLTLSHLSRAEKFNESRIRRQSRISRIPQIISSIVKPLEKSGTGFKEDSDQELSRNSHDSLPRLESSESDDMRERNLEVPKTRCTKLLKTRHHHRHSNPGQHKTVHVEYIPKISSPGPKLISTPKPKFSWFNEARPRKQPSFDQSMPRVLSEELRSAMESHLKPASSATECFDSKSYEVFPKAQMRPINAGLRESVKFGKNTESTDCKGPELDNGKEKNSDQMKALLFKIDKHKIKESVIDMQGYKKELEEELKSIESCVSSIESSACTDFTDDSGSLIVLNGKKIPLDYIRKPFRPFERFDHTRVKGLFPTSDEILSRDPEFTEHKMDEKLSRNAGLKKTARKTLNREGFSQQRVKPFKRITSIQLMRDAIYKKFLSLNIAESRIEMKLATSKAVIYSRKTKEYIPLFEPLFYKWEKRYNMIAKLNLNKVSSCKKVTDELKDLVVILKEKLAKLKSDILFVEIKLMARIILQNFHYLLMETSWREKHDWIHLKPDGTLENYRESIEKRATKNIRQRTNINAADIKEFYDKIYLKSQHPIIIVFPDAESLLNATLELKSRTFIYLLELHSIMWTIARIQKSALEFQKSSEKFIDEKTKKIINRGAKKVFLEARAKIMKGETEKLMEVDLKKSIEEPRLREVIPLVNLWFDKVMSSEKNTTEIVGENLIMKLELVSLHLIELLDKLEYVPKKKWMPLDKQFRIDRRQRRNKSKQAFLLEQRVEKQIQALTRNMQPPFKKEKQIKKLPRLCPKKKEVEMKGRK